MNIEFYKMGLEMCDMNLSDKSGALIIQMKRDMTTVYLIYFIRGKTIHDQN